MCISRCEHKIYAQCTICQPYKKPGADFHLVHKSESLFIDIVERFCA